MSGTTGSMKVKGNPIVTARNLVTTVIGQTGQKLFGGVGTLNSRSYRGIAIEVPNGDLAAFFRSRIERYGITGIKAPSAKTFDAAVIEVARQIGKQSGYGGDLNPQQVERIALEYVTSSCFLVLNEVEPFATYLQASRQYRKVVKDLNAAAALTEAKALDAKDVKRFEALNGNGAKAWGEIYRILSASKHLATLRTSIVVPALFQTQSAWEEIAGLERTTRDAVLSELQAMVAESGNPFVSDATVVTALQRAQGNQLLASGHANGVDAATIVHAMAQTTFARAKANGGKETTLEGMPASLFGAQIGGLRGTVTSAKVTESGQGTVSITAEVVEGIAPDAPFAVPVEAPSAQQQRWAA